MRKRTGNSELECFTLGLIWQLGPCTPYQIRKQMLDSPSSQWSGSAGAIYPLIRRLERRRFVRSLRQATGKRKHKIYSITAQGERALKAWIGPPLSKAAITVTYDPLRSRARFLRVLSQAQRIAWVQAALNALDEVAAMVDAWEQLYGDRDSILHLITRNGVLEQSARRQWLTEVLQQMKKNSRS